MQDIISIHAPTGGATWPEWKYSARWRNFNPRSHGGSDCGNAKEFRKQAISIHAPTGGATVWGGLTDNITGISIHAPTGGATVTPIAASLGITTISIHAPTGGATGIVTDARVIALISIHAPTGGATAKVTKFK